MADSKITGLPDNTRPLLTDHIEIVDDPAASPASQELALVDLLGSGWLEPGETWVYVSATSFMIVGVDRTARYRVGRKLRCKQGGGYKYFYVISSSFATNTTVTITGGSDFSLANASITDNYFSYVETPEGFPDWFAYTPTVTSGTGTFTTVSATGRFALIGRVVVMLVTVIITTNGTAGTSVKVSLPVTAMTTDVAIGVGRENTVTGNMLQTQLSAAMATVFTYNNLYPGGDGRQIQLSQLYQMA